MCAGELKSVLNDGIQLI